MSDKNISKKDAQKKGNVTEVNAAVAKLEAESTIVGVKGTVAKILHDGSGDQPFRALIEMKPGMVDLMMRPRLGKAINKTLIITSEVPLDAAAGDDLHVTGLLYRSHDNALPSEVILPKGAPVHNRMRGMLKDGVEIKGFGEPTKEQKARPGEIMVQRIKPKKSVPTITKDAMGAVIVKASLETGDEAISWATKLFEPVPHAGSLSIIDPMAFLPKASTSNGYWAKRFAEKKRIKNNGEKLEKYLPESTPSMISKMMGQHIAVSPGLALPMLYDGMPGNERLSKEGYVVPFSPFFSSSSLWAGLSNLNGNAFSPKVSIDPKLQKKFILAHEMAHTVQAGYGIIHNRDTAGVNLGEKFADSFACLAVAQATGDFETLKAMANIRHNHLFMGGMTHYTGPAFDDAVALAEILHKDGRLAKMTANDMLKVAHNIAKTHELTQPQILDIIRTRGDIYDKVGIKTQQPGFFMRRMMKKGGYDPRMGGAMDMTGGDLAVKSIRAALAKDPEALGAWSKDFARSVAALDATAWTLDELKDEVIRKKALEVYATDIEANAKLVDYDPEIMKVLYKVEENSNDDAQKGWRSLFTKKRRGFKVENGMGVSRLAYLKAKSGGYTGDAAAKRFEHITASLKKAAAKTPFAAHEPVTMVRRNTAKTTLNNAMAATAEVRLNTLIQMMTNEVNVLKQFRGNPQNTGLLGQATQYSQNKRDLAFSIRIDAKGFAEIKDKMGIDVAHEITAMAKAHPFAYNRVELAIPMEERLLKELRKFHAVLHPTKGLKESGLEKDLNGYLPVMQQDIEAAQKKAAVEAAKEKAKDDAKKDANTKANTPAKPKTPTKPLNDNNGSAKNPDDNKPKGPNTPKGLYKLPKI